jgi:hypothetical protein
MMKIGRKTEKALENITGVFALSLACAGIGALNSEATEKHDDALRMKLSEDQMEIILAAAKSETCEIIRPTLQRICLAESQEIELAQAETPEM